METAAGMVASAQHALESARASLTLGKLPDSTLSLEQAARRLQDALAACQRCMPANEERSFLLAAVEQIRIAVRTSEALNSRAGAFHNGWAGRIAEALGIESGFAYGPGKQTGLVGPSSRIHFEA
ncbi:MAG: hypothetical protein IANPNBLG_01033 [Bryobacteraceae bacterium]|nr:hypothetical protein [Bryobacteraceae bacterium]